jgi:hypothetical protein
MRHKASFHFRAEIIPYAAPGYKIKNPKSKIETADELSTTILSALVGSCRDTSRQEPTLTPVREIVPYLSPMSQSSHRVRSPVERAGCQVPTHRGPQRAASFIFAPFAIFCKTVRNRIKAPLCQNKLAPQVAALCMQLRANPYTQNFPPKTCAMFRGPHSPLRGLK